MLVIKNKIIVGRDIIYYVWVEADRKIQWAGGNWVDINLHD